MEKMLEEAQQTRQELEIERTKRKEFEEQLAILGNAKKDLLLQLNAETAANEDAEDRCIALIKSKIELDGKMKEMQDHVEAEEEYKNELITKKRNLELECTDLKKQIDGLQLTVVKIEKEKTATEQKVRKK